MANNKAKAKKTKAKKPNKKRSRTRKNSSSFTTHSGNTVRVKRNYNQKRKATKDAKARRKAAALATLPHNPVLRQIHRMHPKRLAKYWFSRDGVIMALKVVGVAVVVCFVLLIGLFAYFRKDLPKINSLDGNKLGGSITYYDRSGKTVLWQDYNAVKRVPVEGKNMSKHLKQATVAIEDQEFYSEGAFDAKAIVRAGLNDLLGIGSNKTLQGGSTITQQLVKLNEQWTNDRTIGRKIKELILAIDLNREYSKDQILAGYLNIAPYGGVDYGCESAARDYFHTSCKDLTLAQSAMLAAIPQAPSYYSPYSSSKWNPAVTQNDFNQEALLHRKDYVLSQMTDLKMITKKQAKQAKEVDVLAQVKKLSPKFSGIKHPYFVLSAKQALEEKYGAATVKRGGWKVTTTLSSSVQNKANELIADNLPVVKRAGGDEEAMVIEDVPTGQIIGLVGGTDFDNPSHGKINYASSVKVAPGSSIKPYVYTTLINDTNAGAGSVLYDKQQPIIDPSTGAGYPCTDKALPDQGGNCLWNNNRKYPGPETLRYALAGSRNVPAVKAIIQAGVKNTTKTATKMMDPTAKKQLYQCYADAALTKPNTCGPAAGIGDGAYLNLDDHANGLSTLGRMGKSIPRTYILKITDSSGKVIDKYSKPKGKQVIKKDTAYIVNNMLSDPRASYFSNYAKLQSWNGWDFAIKTGTTNDNTDYLMTGWSTQYAVVSWAGYHTRNVSMSGSSDTITYALTAPMMKFLHQNKDPVNWKEPKGIQHLPAYVMYSGKGMMYGAQFPSPKTDIYPSWYKPKSRSNKPVTIDKVSNKLATKCTPKAAQKTVTNGNANSFSIDQFVDGKYGKDYNASAKDDVHDCDDTKPSVDLSITSQGGGSTDTCEADSGCIIRATARAGSHPLNSNSFSGKLIIKVNGKERNSFHVTRNGQSVKTSWKPSATGQATISAEIIDSVLYSGSDSVTVDTVGATKKLSFGSATTDGGKTTFTWSGGKGPFKVSTNSNGSNPFCNTSGNSCTTTDPIAEGTTIYVRDTNGTVVSGETSDD